MATRHEVQVILSFGLFHRGETLSVSDAFMAAYGRYLVPLAASGPLPMEDEPVDQPVEEPVDQPVEEPVDGQSGDLPSEG